MVRQTEQGAARGSDRSDCTSRFDEDGDTVAMMEVLVRPPSESCRILVSLDSLWGQEATSEPTELLADFSAVR